MGSVMTDREKMDKQLLMKLAVECLKESKNISEDIHERWYHYFVHHCDPAYLDKLITKMLQRMREFEPEIIRNTTAHIGYYDV